MTGLQTVCNEFLSTAASHLSYSASFDSFVSMFIQIWTRNYDFSTALELASDWWNGVKLHLWFSERKSHRKVVKSHKINWKRRWAERRNFIRRKLSNSKGKPTQLMEWRKRCDITPNSRRRRHFRGKCLIFALRQSLLEEKVEDIQGHFPWLEWEYSFCKSMLKNGQTSLCPAISSRGIPRPCKASRETDVVVVSPARPGSSLGSPVGGTCPEYLTLLAS